MKLELSDGMSNNSDFSNDSQNSQMSAPDFLSTMGNGLLLTPTTYITLEGLNSGVPTRTTPTLTPTTLRNIEQTFIELQSKPEPHENEAGFVPPLVQLIGNNQYSSLSSDDVYSNKSQSIWQSSLSQSSSDSNTRSTPPLAPNTNLINNTPPSGRRNMGGRKPAKDVNVSPEEEERRRVRRERNKAAAARCRKRRVDHTNQLIKETEELEDKKRELERHIEELNGVRDELEFLLQTHKSSPGMCRRRPGSPPDIKPSLLAPQPYGLPPVSVSSAHHHQQQQEPKIKTEEDHQHHQQQQQHHHQQQQQQHSHQHHHHQLQHDVDPDMFPLPSAKRVMLSQTVPICKPSRPNTLNVGLSGAKTLALSELAGIPISTPSSGLQFNFDSLMGGGTGLTPVSAPLVPSCSTQQRHVPTSTADIMSPDTCGSIKLVSL